MRIFLSVASVCLGINLQGEEVNGYSLTDIKNGLHKGYHENTVLTAKGEVKNGKEGIWFFYRKNGTPERQITFKNGMRNGPLKRNA